MKKILLLLLISLCLAGQSFAAELFYAESVNGNSSGSDCSNSKDLSSLEADFAARSAGDDFWICFENGVKITESQILLEGLGIGSSTNHAFITGIEVGGDIDGKKPTFTSNRGKNDPWVSGSDGSDIFQISADNVTFRNLAFEGVKHAFVVVGTADSVTIEDVDIDWAKWGINNVGTNLNMTNLTMKNVRATHISRSLIRLEDASSDILVEDTYVSTVDGETSAQAFEYRDTTARMRHRRVTTENITAYMNDGSEVGSNLQGDGFGNEADTSDFYCEDCVVKNCTDSGFDLKGDNNMLIRPIVDGCKNGMKFWDTGLTTYIIDPIIKNSKNYVESGATAINVQDAQVKVFNPTIILNSDTQQIFQGNFNTTGRLDIFGGVIHKDGKSLVAPQSGFIFNTYETLIDGIVSTDRNTFL